MTMHSTYGPSGSRTGNSTEHVERNAQDGNLDISSDDRGEDIPREQSDEPKEEANTDGKDGH